MVIVTLLFLVILDPPLEAVYHPRKVYPLRFTVGSVPYVFPHTAVIDALEGLAPEPLNLTVIFLVELDASNNLYGIPFFLAYL